MYEPGLHIEEELDVSQQFQDLPEQTPHAYMVFFSNEWAMPPAFYWIDEVQGISPQDAYKRNLERIIQAARDYEPDIFGDMSADDIEEGLCVVPRDNWMSRYHSEWQVLLAEPN